MTSVLAIAPARESTMGLATPQTDGDFNDDLLIGAGKGGSLRASSGNLTTQPSLPHALVGRR